MISDHLDLLHSLVVCFFSTTLFNESLSYLCPHVTDYSRCRFPYISFLSTINNFDISFQFYTFINYSNIMAMITDNDKYVLNAIFNPNYPLDFDKESLSDSTNSENESESFLNIISSYNYAQFLFI